MPGSRRAAEADMCPSLQWARHPQLLHLVCERRPLEAQARCRSMNDSDNPIAFLECSHNLLSLGLLQRIATASRANVCKNFSQRHSQRRTGREQDGSLHKVLQFPDITWPGIVGERIHRFFGNTLDLFSHAPSVLVGEVADEKRNVVTAVAQRWDINRKHLQTIVKITAELFFGDHLGETGIRSRYQANIDALGASTAQSLKFLFLQDS